MSSPYFDSISSEAAWRREFSSKKYSDTTFSKALGNTSASEWGRGQLVRLHVVIRTATDEKLLPLIVKDKPAKTITKAISEAAIETSDDTFWSRYPESRKALRTLLKGRGQGGVSERELWSEQEYMRHYGSCEYGRLWAALDRLEDACHISQQCTEVPGPHYQDDDEQREKNPAPTTPPSPHPRSSKRARRSVRPFAGVVPFDQNTPITDSSSSPQSAPPNDVLSSSPHSAAYVPATEAVCSSERTEDLTVDFIVTALRIILLHVPPQQQLDSAPRDRNDGFPPTVDLDVQKLQLRVTISNLIQFGSIDDGGLWIRSLSKKTRARVAVLEAKRFIGHVDDGCPVLSDPWLAQIVGEALAVRLAPDTWMGPRETIIVIAAARYFVRFFQLRVTDSYLEDLSKCVATEAAKPKTEPPPAALEADETPRESIQVSCTRWFDFRESTERVHVVRNLSGIVKLAQDEAQG
ncbi:hypothetical protein CDEST_15325 [Colletotrichum destructivum]|uniref:Uncharacterized protein n=1 Tax=Colletotrichum destructivum TaxID=34406 RepID=A0AAX4J476_9PEZI|nr:hypothetical protein CDEST_15325 [Colletotrichum destructivum]